MYGIIWDSNNQRYDLAFEQVPMTFGTSDESDLYNTVNNLTDLFNYRYNRLGVWYKEAREIEHFIFTPTTDISFQDFYSKFGSNVRLDTCVSRDDYINTVLESYTGNNKVVIRTNMSGVFNSSKTYEISVKYWWNYYVGSGSLTDKTISIYERPVVPPKPELTCDEISGTCLNAGPCEAGGGYCDGLRGCTGGECCCT